jgi:hypothetical protein
MTRETAARSGEKVRAGDDQSLLPGTGLHPFAIRKMALKFTPEFEDLGDRSQASKSWAVGGVNIGRGWIKLRIYSGIYQLIEVFIG